MMCVKKYEYYDSRPVEDGAETSTFIGFVWSGNTLGWLCCAALMKSEKEANAANRDVAPWSVTCARLSAARGRLTARWSWAGEALGVGHQRARRD